MLKKKIIRVPAAGEAMLADAIRTVSYTHLTLPTKA